jgi:hypothetical protein
MKNRNPMSNGARPQSLQIREGQTGSRLLLFLLAGWLFGCAGSQPQPLLALLPDAADRLTHVVMLDGRTGETNESSEPTDIATTLTLLQSLEVTRQADQSARAGYLYWLDLYAGERLARLTFGGQTVQIDGVYYDLDRSVEAELDDLFAALGAETVVSTRLTTDINQYLTRFQIPNNFPQPVTAAHLLTHTGGFDEWDIGAATRTQDKVLPVCDYLAQRLVTPRPSAWPTAGLCQSRLGPGWLPG